MPGRTPNADRSTPHFDKWLAELVRSLSDRGAKTGLARYLAGDDSAKLQTQKVRISKVLTGDVIPDAEFVLAVNSWLQKQANHR